METVFLTETELREEIVSRPGLIPISINVSPDRESRPHRIVWMDFDRYHAYEGFFHQAIANYNALVSGSAARFTSSLEVLGSSGISDALPPSGFIFHGGRCGSTLLAKVLARSREHIVFSEAAPHNLVWRVLPGLRGTTVDSYRRLVVSMGRRRLDSYRAHFIKYTSFNIMKFELIRAAFPGTPALFLFRHPDGVLDSSVHEIQPWLGNDMGVGKIWSDASDALRDFYMAALEIRDPLFRCLDYAAVSPRNLDVILEFFGAHPSSGREIELMRSEFEWNAKSRIPRRFTPRPSAAPLADPCLLALYAELSNRARAQWPRELV